MTKPVPRPTRKPPAYPTLVACLVGTVNLVGCKGSPPEAPAGSIQPTLGLGGAATSTNASSKVPSPPEMMAGVPPPMFVEPADGNSAAIESVPPTATVGSGQQPQQVTAGGKSPARLPVPSKPPVHKTAGKPMPAHDSDPFQE